MSLENRKRVLKVEYDHARDGGAIGSKVLRGPKLSPGVVVDIGKIVVHESLTSAGAATVGLGLVAAGDVKAPGVLANWAAGVNATVPSGAAANCIKTNEVGEVTMTVGVADLTAGKFDLFLEYYLLD
jgi:hypothetical protein